VTAPAADVATRLGYELRRGASASSCKCPACGTDRRHRKSRDRRGSVGLPHAKPQAWHCFTCEESGDAIDFASWHIGGARFRDLPVERKAEVKEWFGFAEDLRVLPPAAPRSRPAERPVQLENLEAEYPPRSEAERFWESCRPISDDVQVLDYLAWREVPAGKLVIHDCARALPAGLACPPWARFGESDWSRTGHRLIVPLYDFLGEMRSFVARSIERAPAKKSLGVQGYGRRGLVMAGTYGRAMLSTGAIAHWHRLERLRLTIAEGEIDTLRAVATGADDELESDYRPAAFRAVLGIFAGSFTRDVASRVPSGTTVVIATDADEQGDKYAADVRDRIGERCDFERVRMEQDRKVAE
jgi:hypothetical protein